MGGRSTTNEARRMKTASNFGKKEESCEEILGKPVTALYAGRDGTATSRGKKDSHRSKGHTFF